MRSSVSKLRLMTLRPREAEENVSSAIEGEADSRRTGKEGTVTLGYRKKKDFYLDESLKSRSRLLAREECIENSFVA